MLVVHNYPTFGSSPAAGLYKRAAGLIAGLICKRLVTVSNDCARSLSPFVAPEKLRVISNGLAENAPDYDIARLKADLQVSGSPVVGSIANIEKRKGLSVLVEAFASVRREFPAAQLVLIGTPVEPAEDRGLRDTVHRLGLDQAVRFAGYVPNATRYVACFDVCAAPSVARESFGLLALDAMRHAKPIVASRLGGLAEIIEDGVTGRLVPPGDPNALATALVELLKSPETAQKLARQGHDAWRRRYTARAMAAQYSALA